MNGVEYEYSRTSDKGAERRGFETVLMGNSPTLAGRTSLPYSSNGCLIEPDPTPALLSAERLRTDHRHSHSLAPREAAPRTAPPLEATTTMASPITCHVLDSTLGRPGKFIEVKLDKFADAQGVQVETIAMG